MAQAYCPCVTWGTAPSGAVLFPCLMKIPLVHGCWCYEVIPLNSQYRIMSSWQPWVHVHVSRWEENGRFFEVWWSQHMYGKDCHAVERTGLLFARDGW
jgi:hypothetical protein